MDTLPGTPRGSSPNGVKTIIPTITRDDDPEAADKAGVMRQHSLQQQPQQQQPQKKSSFLDSFRPRSKSDATRSTRKPNLFAAHKRLVGAKV